MYYLLSQNSFFEYVMASAVGTKMPRGDKAVIMGYRTRIPSETSEQQAVADVISTINNEIVLSNRRLVKVRQMKRAMIQLLMTGKDRLS